MIEFLQQYIISEVSAEGKMRGLREALQLLCLKILQDKKYFSCVAFVGGTALRVLYDMKRFSEDLDFSVIDKNEYDFSGIISTLKREYKLRGLELEVKTKIERTVQSGMLKFPGLPKTLGISESATQKLSIKVEVDSMPPSGWQIEDTTVNKIYLLHITHFTVSSLYATKIHACFFRKYAKGRDFYDLLWYLGKKVKPNYELLNNAIEQTHGEIPRLNDKNIKNFLLDKIATIDFGAIKKDAERFLEDKNELRLLEAPVVSKGIIDVFE